MIISDMTVILVIISALPASRSIEGRPEEDPNKSGELLVDLRIKQSALAEPLSTSIAAHEQDSSDKHSIHRLPCMQEH